MSSLKSLKELDYSLDQFVQYFDNVKDNDLKIEIASSSSGHDSVKMLNIYKSKGLEYPILYVIGVNNAFNEQRWKQDFIVTSKYGIIYPLSNMEHSFIFNRNEEEEKASDTSEKVRLFYVELTRAKEKVIVSMPDIPSRDTGRKIRQFLDEFVNDPEFVYTEKTLEEDKPCLHARADYNCFYCGNIIASDGKFVTIKGINSSDVHSVGYLCEKCAKQMLSGQPLFTFERDGYLSLNEDEISTLAECNIPVEENKIEIKRASKKLSYSAQSEILTLGTRLHEYLEIIDFASHDTSFVTDEKERKLIDNFFDNEFIKNVCDGRVYKEYEFIDEVHGRQGIIDCLIIKDNKAYIIDYKLKNITDEHYKDQLKVYYDYVESSFGLKAKCYLYSIIGSVFKKIVFEGE